MRVYWSVHLHELSFCTLRPGEQGGVLKLRGP
jgi:hypothetical protein